MRAEEAAAAGQRSVAGGGLEEVKHGGRRDDEHAGGVSQFDFEEGSVCWLAGGVRCAFAPVGWLAARRGPPATHV
jgi:hypothetical protein